MKRIIIICTLVAGFSAAHAQTSDRSYATTARIKSPKAKPTMKHDNIFEGTEMARSNGSISFSNLPDMTKAPWAVITDEKGDLIKQSRIIPEESIDIHKLSKGMYFVSLVYKNKTKKAFMLEIE